MQNLILNKAHAQRQPNTALKAKLNTEVKKKPMPTTSRLEVSPDGDKGQQKNQGRITPSPKHFKEHFSRGNSPPPLTEERGAVVQLTQNQLRSPSSGARKIIDNENSDHESSNSRQSNPYRRKQDINKKLEGDKKKYDKFLLAPKTLKVINLFFN